MFVCALSSCSAQKRWDANLSPDRCDRRIRFVERILQVQLRPPVLRAGDREINPRYPHSRSRYAEPWRAFGAEYKTPPAGLRRNLPHEL